jgi:crotonobetainyl-CoA:carnitine CoA-transferase CaiB-like acyl-CoA transferase
VTRRAPLPGEHNEDIYVRELGYPEEKLRELKRDGII